MACLLMLVLLFIAAKSNGDIVDLTLVTNHPFLDPPYTRDQYIGAYLGQKDASIRDSITFDRIIRTVDTASLPDYSDTVDEGQDIRKLIFEQSNQTKASGAFNAAFEYEGTTRTSSTVVLMHNATILPEQTTLAVHEGEDVTLDVVTNVDDFRWRFNGDVLQDSRRKQSLTLPNVRLNQAGVYKCFVVGNRWDAGNAILLLHVVRCPAYRWGSECEHNCTECLNGGKCDADSGECVCPPGFKGTTCEHVLGSNRFGQDGSFSCDTSGDDHSPGCRGKLFCLPDPFGCTCAAGFMGINCTTECNPGTYGANCLQECHCSPRNICTKDTGECIDGTACQEGWTGVNCQAIPGTKSAGSGITSSTIPIVEATIQVSTRATTSAPTTVHPQPVPSYAIESFNYTKVNNGEPTTLVCVVTGSPPPTSENISVTHTAGGDEGIFLLETNVNESTRTSRYQVIVSLGEVHVPLNFTCLLRRPDGESVSKDLAVSVYETPSFVESNILVQEMTSHSITLRWTPWNETYDNGDGPVIGYQVYYNTPGQDDIARASRDLIRDTTFTITNLTRDTKYEFRVTASREGPAGEGTYSQVAGARTKCTGPACVQALRVSSSITTVEVSWELSSSQCSPDYYIIRYSLYQKLACSSPETTPSEFEVNTTSTQLNNYNLVGLEPYSRYKISVIAVNGAGQSEPTIGYSDTRPGSPSNITNVRVNPERMSPTRLGFTWQPLNCRNVNGDFWYYYPRIYKDGDRSNPAARRIYLDDDISYSSVEFNGLEACTMYELSINAGNRDVSTTGKVSYAIGVTGVTFTSASAYATGNQLRVHWSVPSQCNVEYYRLSYQLISRKACEDVSVIDAPVYELNVTSVSTDVSKYISNLEYYATYNISIIAVIWRTESLPMNVSGDTLAGDPTGFPTNIQSTSTNKHSIVFTWETPDCGNRNGPISSYEVMLSNSTGDVVYHGNVSASAEPEHEIFELIPSSNYSIRIRAWNYELAGEYGPAIWVQTN